MTYQDIITIEPGKRSGRPTIRGMRITVADVLGWLAAGMSHEQINPGGHQRRSRKRHVACVGHCLDRAVTALRTAKGGSNPALSVPSCVNPDRDGRRDRCGDQGRLLIR
jgi:hypothetical protein